MKTFSISGELIKKQVSHDETIMTIDDDGDNIMIVLPHDYDDVVRIGQQLMVTISEPTFCKWVYQPDERDCFWKTDCDRAFQFMNDGPEENGYKFCPGCGKEIEL